MQNSKYKLKRTFAWGLTLAILVLALVLAFKAKDIVNDELTLIPPVPAHLELPDKSWEAVRFFTADSVSLAAWYTPSQNGQTIVVMHGFGANRSQVLEVSTMLRDQGFGVFTYDTRAHGESGGNQIGYGEKEVEDLRAAMDWLERRSEVDISRVGVYGFSLGGFIAAREAVGDKRISALVLAGTPSSIFELA
ncbi:MAG: alpha/beta fold hydrolase, partial [Proteobacteria bacterium]